MYFTLEDNPNFKSFQYVIDVPNICGLDTDSNGKPIINVFKKLLIYFGELGISEDKIISYADSSFYYVVNDRIEYKNLIRAKKIINVPAGIKSDIAIISFCLKNTDARIISNDLFREYYSSLPRNWILNKRIVILMVKEEFYLIPMLFNKYKKGFRCEEGKSQISNKNREQNFNIFEIEIFEKELEQNSMR